jgi:TonB family protein
MKVLLAMCVIFISVSARADFQLEPDHVPPPKFEMDAEKFTHDLKAIVKYTIHNDGSVRDISLVESNHDEYANSVLSAVASWRYKPWPLTGNPATTSLILTYTRSADEHLSESHKEIIRNMRCRHLSREVAQYLAVNPQKSLIDMRSARRTRKMLRINPLDLPHQRSMRLNALFNDWFPEIIEKCRDNPDARYLGYLPDELGERLNVR